MSGEFGGLDIPDDALGDIEYDDGVLTVLVDAILDWEPPSALPRVTAIRESSNASSVLAQPLLPAHPDAVSTEPRHRRLGALLTVVTVAAALVVVVIFGVRVVSRGTPEVASHPSPTPSHGVVQAAGSGAITIPTDSGHVDSPSTVSGIVDLPKNQKAWLLVNPSWWDHSGMLQVPVSYAVAGPLKVSSNGHWRAKVVVGFNCKDEGRSYEFFLLSAPRGGVLDQKAKGSIIDNEAGVVVDAIPSDAKILDRQTTTLREFTENVDTHLGCWQPRKAER